MNHIKIKVVVINVDISAFIEVLCTVLNEKLTVFMCNQHSYFCNREG